MLKYTCVLAYMQRETPFDLERLHVPIKIICGRTKKKKYTYYKPSSRPPLSNITIPRLSTTQRK